MRLVAHVRRLKNVLVPKTGDNLQKKNGFGSFFTDKCWCHFHVVFSGGAGGEARSGPEWAGEEGPAGGEGGEGGVLGMPKLINHCFDLPNCEYQFVRFRSWEGPELINQLIRCRNQLINDLTFQNVNNKPTD